MRNPQPRRDYPVSQQDFYSTFCDDGACLDWLEHLRWGSTRHARTSTRSANRVISGSTFVCPQCGCGDALIIKHGRRCRGCRHRVSVLAGTPFHQSRVPLPHLLEAAWMMTAPNSSLNALSYMNLARTTHENAWAILHKYREIMHEEMVSLELHGAVEADECFIGGKPRPHQQWSTSGQMTVVRQPQRKHIVLVVVEKRKGGRVVFKRLNSTQAVEIIPAVCQIVSLPSTVHTDANPSYNTLKATGHRHKVFNISRLPLPAHNYLPNVHSAASNLQRWMLQTINRTPDPKHMDYYLAEAAFRFNHRGARNQGLLFYRLMEAVLNHAQLTQKDVVARQA